MGYWADQPKIVIVEGESEKWDYGGNDGILRVANRSREKIDYVGLVVSKACNVYVTQIYWEYLYTVY